MSDVGDLELLVASRVPIITIDSREETRVIGLFQRIASLRGDLLFQWTATEGLRRLGGEHAPQRMYRKPVDVLSHIRSLSTQGIFLLLDFHPYLDDPITVRLLREIAQAHGQIAKTLALVSPGLSLPDELVHHCVHFSLAVPTSTELEAMVNEEARQWSTQNRGKPVRARSEALKALTRNLAGLTLSDARRLTRNAIYDDGVIDDSDMSGLMKGKYKLLDQGGVLSFELDTAKLSDVAGLENLKRWLSERKRVFIADSPPTGLDAPKGLLLLGVQGGGKSLAAKAVAGAWGVPLLRLDFATLYNKYYGETERNLRESLKTAGSMAPCVLWIDEIEKGLATDQDSGGPSRRILGTLLTWMAEREDKVFLVATANDIEALPPELLRKGRFDEVFFVDLPTASVRCVIFEIHLKKRDCDPTAFDLEELATLSEGFTGAEIEQAVVSAFYSAHAKKMTLESKHLIEELERTRPLSVLMAEKIDYLREWASERTVPAS